MLIFFIQCNWYQIRFAILILQFLERTSFFNILVLCICLVYLPSFGQSTMDLAEKRRFDLAAEYNREHRGVAIACRARGEQVAAPSEDREQDPERHAHLAGQEAERDQQQEGAAEQPEGEEDEAGTEEHGAAILLSRRPRVPTGVS